MEGHLRQGSIHIYHRKQQQTQNIINLVTQTQTNIQSKRENCQNSHQDRIAHFSLPKWGDGDSQPEYISTIMKKTSPIYILSIC